MSEEPSARDRLVRVEGKLDRLTQSVDERFNGVDAAFVEQREYTEFAFEKLRTEMRDGFAAVSERFDGVSERFDGVSERFDGVSDRFDGVSDRFDAMSKQFDGLSSRFDRLERKLDRFIDTQSRTNALVERRLTALEPKSNDSSPG